MVLLGDCCAAGVCGERRLEERNVQSKPLESSQPQLQRTTHFRVVFSPCVKQKGFELQGTDRRVVGLGRGADFARRCSLLYLIDSLSAFGPLELYPLSGRQRSVKQMSQILGSELERLCPEWTSLLLMERFL